MNLNQILVLIRGAGEMASALAWILFVIIVIFTIKIKRIPAGAGIFFEILGRFIKNSLHPF